MSGHALGSKRRGVRLTDVARKAGVSVATASHALLGYRDVSEETRQRVLAAARELNYEVDSLARALVRGRSGLVGILVFVAEGIAHPFFHEVVTSAIEELEALDFNAVVSTVDPGRFEVAPIFRKMIRYRLEGVIVMGIPEDHPAVQRITGKGIPSVFVDAALSGPGYTSVRTDNRLGGYLAARHLLAMGHRRVLFVNDLSDAMIFRDRQEGFLAAFGEHGLSINARFMLRASTWLQDGHKAAEYWLSLPERPTAIFAVDRVALGCIQRLADQGVEVPDAVSVMGYDDIEMAAMSRPPLTTVRQDAPGIARQAVKSLHHLLQDPTATVPPVLVAPELVIRGSVRQVW